MILREDLDMFRQLLAQLIPRRRPFRREAVHTAETHAPEPPSDAGFGEVYHVHAAIHGPNQLLPVDALPRQPGRPQTSRARDGSELT
jgi:hypothetical protein